MRRKLFAASVWGLAACYSPSPPTGAACAMGTCPDPLVCDLATNTCEHSAGGPIDGAADGPGPGDGPARDAPTADVLDAPGDAPGVSPFTELDGVQWLLPCTGSPGSNGLCPSGTFSKVMHVHGPTGDAYQVTLRFRGVSESGTYTGGTAGSGELYTGGAPAQAYLTVIELAVSAPTQHYYFNNGSGIPNAIDYTAQIPIDGSATLTLTATGQDGVEEPNKNGSGQPIVLSGVTTTPSPYDGEFGQLDVLSYTPISPP